MLRFQFTPDKCFFEIVTASLEIPMDMLKEDIEQAELDQVKYLHIPQVAKIFSTELLLKTIEELLEAHEAPELYMPTEYHFLVLYDVISGFAELHNDSLSDEEPATKVGSLLVGEIDFDWLFDMYFWDCDFLTDPEVMNRLSGEAKEMVRFSPETFAVVNRMEPHPDELMLKPLPEKPGTPEEAHYKEGESYPYYGRIPYGSETDSTDADEPSCACCGVEKGELHVSGCAAEECRHCGDWLVMCSCEEDFG